MDDEPTIRPTDQQDHALQRAKDAVAVNNPWGMIEALYQSFVLDGLARQVRMKWPSLLKEDVDFIIAESVDALYLAIHRGKKILDIVAYLWKTCDHKASDYYQIRQQEKIIDPHKLEFIAEQVSEEGQWDDKLKRAISIARMLMPRLGHQNVQAVMTYVIEAVEAGYAHVSNQEIAEALGLSSDTVRQSLSRGFHRLSRIAREENLADREFDIAILGRDSGGLPIDETGPI